MTKVSRLIQEETGIQHAEEALLLALIAVALTVAATTLKNGIGTVFSGASTTITTTY